MNAPVPDERMDLSGVPCPQNSARTLIKLEGMDEGEILEIIIDDGEPMENVPPSLEEDGHQIVGKEQAGDKWIILVRRGND